jgi:hypothetical protein
MDASFRHPALEPSNGSFDWGELPWQIAYANSKGIQVYLTAEWAPQWANGATVNCSPATPNICPQPQDEGFTVTNSSYTYNFFYNLALQFNGSNTWEFPSTSGCVTGSGYNAATCNPLVEYFGTWNEPDGINNYNDKAYDGGNLGNYLNDFVTQYLQPAYAGVKAANPSAHVVAPDLGTGTSIRCGGFTPCGTWQTSWMQQLQTNFSTYYDIISIMRTRATM